MSKKKEASYLFALYQFFGALIERRFGNAMKQFSQPSSLPSPPRPEDFEDWDVYIHVGWPMYWDEVGQAWRKEPLIDQKRQNLLNELRTKRVSYGENPLKDIKPKLTRADIEWLLATHHNGRGPVDWRDLDQREREGLDLRGVDLKHAGLAGLPLARMLGSNPGLSFSGMEQQLDKNRVHLEGAFLREAHLEGAYLTKAYLAEASLVGAHLEEAHLGGTHLESAHLNWAHLEGANLRDAHLEGADLSGAFFDTTTDLNNVTFGNEKVGFVSLADVHWGDVNLSVIDWTQVKMLGEERLARQTKESYDKGYHTPPPLGRYKETRLGRFKTAVRANRQLASVLRDRGLSEEANQFAYRAQILQRIVFRLQTFEKGVKLGQRVRMFSSWVGSGILDILAGYGYHPGKSIAAYLVIIFSFMGLYLLNSLFVCSHLRWDEALVLSISSFHGRGFFSQDVTLGDTYARLAAAEAVVGLLIEISFIATFTQRFFGK